MATYSTSIETFLNIYDAITWLETQLKHLPKDMAIEKAEIVFVNNLWRVGFSMSDKQLQMQFGDED